MKQTLDNAAAIVSQYSNVAGGEALARADSQIEDTWRNLIQYYGEGHALAPKLAIIRARAAAADGDRSRALSAWKTALGLNSAAMPTELMGMNVEAANAAVADHKPQVASQYFAAARAYAFVRGKDAGTARQQLRIQELKQIGGSMQWRELRDALADLRHYSENFPMWTGPRLDALVSEAEIRLMYEPDDKEKREALRQLKTDVQLMQKGMTEDMLSLYTPRIRQLLYTLEDKFKL
ncbi:hypothetical protein [Kordiimonas marina]|uniref:hypothetical protein n=1 Tax=Kordiimonas marina TaxID=2872312 RepID=UPI001FF6EAD4|nr:hypothetical protein [Kordiimonas marina]MCJ9428776.1 hypothetical protein [Kordiimonas marina]